MGRFFDPGMHLHLPAALMTTPVQVWGVREWNEYDCPRIQRAVFYSIGNRTPVVPMSQMEMDMPTRGFFFTFGTKVYYESFSSCWPGGIPPLFFHSTWCLQREYHCHVTMVFHYYSKNPWALCSALGLNPIQVMPIKTTVVNVITYTREQAVENLSIVVNRSEAVTYKNPRRCLKMGTALIAETQSLGPPYAIDGITPRSLPWRFGNVGSVIVERAAVRHVADFEFYESRETGRTDATYRGEAVIVVSPRRNERGQMAVLVPPLATFVVLK
jgi:hypothetical protein